MIINKLITKRTQEILKVATPKNAQIITTKICLIKIIESKYLSMNSLLTQPEQV